MYLVDIPVEGDTKFMKTSFCSLFLYFFRLNLSQGKVVSTAIYWGRQTRTNTKGGCTMSSVVSFNFYSGIQEWSSFNTWGKSMSGWWYNLSSFHRSVEKLRFVFLAYFIQYLPCWTVSGLKFPLVDTLLKRSFGNMCTFNSLKPSISTGIK